jgi:hypothetical protein
MVLGRSSLRKRESSGSSEWANAFIEVRSLLDREEDRTESVIGSSGYRRLALPSDRSSLRSGRSLLSERTRELLC